MVHVKIQTQSIFMFYEQTQSIVYAEIVRVLRGSLAGMLSTMKERIRGKGEERGLIENDTV
jgi:hypothetical protein